MFSNTQNPTCEYLLSLFVYSYCKANKIIGDYFDVAYWSAIEINTGIMCACMPNIRVLLIRVFPKVLGTIKSSLSSSQPPGYGSELNETSNSANQRKHNRTATNTSSKSWYGSGIRQTKEYDVEFGPSAQEQEMRESNIELVYIPPKQDM